jgi:glycosyltransferase involved in cell wall biosynthesis
MRVISTPDFRALAPYQQLLADALVQEGVETVYLSGYPRYLPLLRGTRHSRADILHLHFLARFFLNWKPSDPIRKLRYIPDLCLSTAGRKLVYTVHNLRPLCHQPTRVTDFLKAFTVRHSSALIAHSAAAREALVSRFGIQREKCAIIPHGDFTASYGPPLDRAAARKQLGLGDQPICLAFGSLLPYKGVEELIAFWKRANPKAVLTIVGWSPSSDYENKIKSQIAGVPGIDAHWGFQPDDQFRLWASAADCMVLNYQFIFTSGVACVARSWGVPVLLPRRLTTVDLMEPDPTVFRYDELDTDFESVLTRALGQPHDYEGASAWRQYTAWPAIAAETAKVYRRALAGTPIAPSPVATQALV